MRLARVVAAVALTAACSGQDQTAIPPRTVPAPSSPSESASAAGGSPEVVVPAVTPGRAGDWPDTAPPTAASCVSTYPDGLRAHAHAFDATVTGVTVGTFDDNAGMRPATVDLVVHEVLAGPELTTVTLRTWDGFLPRPDPRSAVGLRVLASAGPTLDLQGCGYTRPYDAADARRWREIYAAPAEPEPARTARATINIIGDMNKGDDGLRADFRVILRRPDGGRVVAYTVSWGDGQTSAAGLPVDCPAPPGPLLDDFVIRHSYPRHGLYDVVVKVVTGGCGAPEDAVRGQAQAAVGPQPGSH